VPGHWFVLTHLSFQKLPDCCSLAAIPSNAVTNVDFLSSDFTHRKLTPGSTQSRQAVSHLSSCLSTGWLETSGRRYSSHKLWSSICYLQAGPRWAIPSDRQGAGMHGRFPKTQCSPFREWRDLHCPKLSAGPWTDHVILWAVFFCGTGAWTQGFALAKQVHCLSHTSTPFCSGYLGDRGLTNYFPQLASYQNLPNLNPPK
jgi:hypothetical protein